MNKQEIISELRCLAKQAKDNHQDDPDNYTWLENYNALIGAVVLLDDEEAALSSPIDKHAVEKNVIDKIGKLRYTADDDERKTLEKEIYSLLGDTALDKLYIAFHAHDSIFLCLLLINLYENFDKFDKRLDELNTHIDAMIRITTYKG